MTARGRMIRAGIRVGSVLTAAVVVAHLVGLSVAPSVQPSDTFKLKPRLVKERVVARGGLVPDRFDRWAATYDDSALGPAYAAAHAAVLDRAGRFVTRPRRVLDVGCGTGRLLSVASPAFPGAALVGLDVSAEMLAIAATGPPAVVRAAAEGLPFLGGSFDLVVTTMSLRHWSDQRAGLGEVARVLAPGGVFGLADVLALPTRGLRALVARGRAGPGLAATTAEPAHAALLPTLRASGLNVLDVHTVHGYGPICAITVVVARRVRTRG
jgi:SAM-dependent methyltransferase